MSGGSMRAKFVTKFTDRNPVIATERPDVVNLRVTVDVCICTYRRPGLIDTLHTVAAQHRDGKICLRVIVADNSDDAGARTVVGAARDALALDIDYVHAPARNISIARNACLDHAQGEWIAFLDDDELASAGWLKALLEEADRRHWDAVLGPVEAVYEEGAPKWLRAGDFHSVRPVWVRGKIETGYTGNVLIKRAFVERTGLRFRRELGRSGGEDVDFFYRLRDAGGRIGFAADAVVREPVARDRANLAWLLKRRFRAGQTHGSQLLQRAHHPASLLIALAKAMFCGTMAGVFLTAASRRTHFLTRAALHSGVVARLAGIREIDCY